MESAQPFGRYGRKTSRKPGKFPYPASSWSGHDAGIAGFRIPFSLILSRENRRTRALTTAMDVVGATEFSGLCPPSLNFFDREQSPYGIVLTLKNKRDKNRTITGKARVFRVSGVFTGLVSEK